MTPDPKARFTDLVRETIARYNLLPRLAPGEPRETVVVGTSGGPDSVALLRVLAALAKKELAVTLIAAHVNHGLRGAVADEDQAFVEGLARQMGLACEAARIDVRAEAQALGIGIEEAGRLVRRRFLAETARKHGARKVALAHHADDRAETVLFNILRGTGIEGLAALKPRAPLPGLLRSASPGPVAQSCRPGQRPGFGGGGFGPASEPGRCPGLHAREANSATGAPDLPRTSAVGTETHRANGGTGDTGAGIEIIRPLIDTPRHFALGYLGAISQPYREDETNRTDAHTRNRIRNALLPLLAKEFNPKVEEALVRLSEQASAAGDVLADALDEVWRKIVREAPPAAWVIDADDFVGLRPWMQGALIRRAVSLLGGGLKHMSADRTREVVSALMAKTIVGPIDLPGGLAAARNRRAIRIGQDKGGRTP
jgi:tRNA(Ile)-lysidine synthase